MQFIHSFLPFLERANNFPPLPKIVRIRPCFYQNIEEEIPDHHQLLVRRVYQLWMREWFHCYGMCVSWFQLYRRWMEYHGFSTSFSHVSAAVYSATLCINVISCIAWWAGGGGAINFGYSLLWLILFSPCSYTCWFRPLYKAFRSVQLELLKTLGCGVYFIPGFFVFCLANSIFLYLRTRNLLLDQIVTTFCLWFTRNFVDFW